jgi:hypothetical protein
MRDRQRASDRRRASDRGDNIRRETHMAGMKRVRGTDGGGLLSRLLSPKQGNHTGDRLATVDDPS